VRRGKRTDRSRFSIWLSSVISRSVVSYAAMGRWTKLSGGKYEGHTLPYVVLHNPDYFFWMCEESTNLLVGPLGQEAREIAAKAKRIRIPRDRDGRLVVEYRADRTTGRFAGFDIVDVSDENESNAPRTRWIDLSAFRLFGSYDKRGGRLMVGQLKACSFGTSKTRLTTARCEEFFEDDANFILRDRD
jgi:hypothetical protein